MAVNYHVTILLVQIYPYNFHNRSDSIFTLTGLNCSF